MNIDKLKEHSINLNDFNITISPMNTFEDLKEGCEVRRIIYNISLNLKGFKYGN